MSGLSSRVKSMKFMQQVGSAGLKDIEDSPQKKVTLLSEWTLPHAAEVVERSRQKSQVDTIGYGSISAFESADETAVPQGRKVWGKPDESIRQIDIGRIKDSIIADGKAGKGAEKAGKDAEDAKDDEDAEDDDAGDNTGDENAKNGGSHGKAKKQKGKRKASSARKSNKKHKK